MEYLSENNRSKVIIISGFLGAGKTTLIESLLKAPHLSKKIAVIQNEFSAEMGLEQSLMKDSEGNEIQDFYEMPNGCICCAGKSDLINTLDTLLAKKPEIEYILVETNGLADPSQIIQTFWVDDGLGSKVVLHQNIGVIDTKNFSKKMKNHSVPHEDGLEQKFNESELLMRQLIYADKILLNKVDLLTSEGKDEELKRINDIILNINPTATIAETVYAQTALEFLITKDASQSQKLVDKCCQENGEHTHYHHAVDHIQSIYVNVDSEDQIIDYNKFEQLFGQLIWEKLEGQEIMRCKGTFIARNDEGKLSEFLLQGVEELFELRQIQECGDKTHFKHRFLIIGKNLKEKFLTEKISQQLIKL